METLKQLTDILENLKYLEHLPEIRRLLAQGAPTVETLALAEPIEPPAAEAKAEPAKEVEKVEKPVEKPPEKPPAADYAAEFDELKALLEGPTWPPAVDADLICDDDNLADKLLRAEGIIEFMIDESLEGKKFLDYGCGEGHVVLKSMEKKPALAVGYDVKPQGWDALGLEAPNKVTSDWAEALKDGPYDLVLMYDVLDHLEGDNSGSTTAVDALRQARAALKPGGRIYIRCHPWTSRHATHLYKKVNKAYIHLVFTEVELARLGYTGSLKCQKIIHPHATYKQWFNDAELDLVNENAIQENLEDFFHQTPLINQRIKLNYKGVSLDADLAAGRSFPSYQLKIQFVDYIIKST